MRVHIKKNVREEGGGTCIIKNIFIKVGISIEEGVGGEGELCNIYNDIIYYIVDLFIYLVQAFGNCCCSDYTYDNLVRAAAKP